MAPEAVTDDQNLARDLEELRVGLENASRVMQQAATEIAGLKAENAMLRAALADIREGRGAFSRDQHQFALNVIEQSKRIANSALAGTYEHD
jgi:hypothetical protein